MRRLSAVLVALLAATVLAGLAPPAFAAAPVTYVAPVDGRVVDGFRPPSTTYGRGNRGLEYATPANSAIVASAPGRVSFAGNVGGALHVVVQHTDGVRTTYAFARTIAVRVGASVEQGERIGTTGSSFHFGARVGDAYLDPAILLAYGPARVHLVPDGEFREEGASDDRRSLLSITADHFGSVTSAAAQWAQHAYAAGAGALDAGAELFGDAAFAAITHLVTVLDEIVNLGEMAGPFAALAASLADILQSFIEPCTPPAVAPTRVSEPRVVVFVGGLGSHSDGPTDDANLSKRLRARDLYTDAQLVDFSYSGGRNPKAYDARDTVGDIRDRARDLRDLLDKLAGERPGVPVDLVAHSQGGLIVREALAHDYDAAHRRLPLVKHVVTLGTPHHGADVATLNAWLRWSFKGRLARAFGSAAFDGFDVRGKSLSQLAETSDFVERINDRPLREGVAYTSIGAANDIVVPNVRARLAGAANVLVDAGNPVAAHSGLTDSESARTELARAIADEAPTCQPLSDTARRAFTGAGIANFEDAAGLATAGATAP